jgi:uncharacterized protein DUF4397
VNRRWKPQRRGVFMLPLVVTFFAFGCGGGSNGKVRVMNASPNEADVDVLIDSKTVAGSVAYGTATSYLSVNSGSRSLQIDPTGTTSPIITQTLAVNSGSFYTVLVANFAPSVVGVVLADDNTTPASGQVEIRVVNASPGLPAEDVYVVAPNTDLTTVGPTASSLVFEGASAYQSLSAGNYEVYCTLPGQKFIYVDSGPLTLSSQQIRTVVSLNSQNGGFTAATLPDLN